MARTQQMGAVGEGLRREQGHRLGHYLDDFPPLETADRYKIAGQLAVRRVIGAERKQLVIGRVVHGSLRNRM